VRWLRRSISRSLSSPITSIRAEGPAAGSGFLAEVPESVAKKTAKSPDDEQSTFEEAERLAGNLTSVAMTGHPRQPGEDEMQVSFHSIPRMSDDLTDRRADAEKDGVRVWLLGAVTVTDQEEAFE